MACKQYCWAAVMILAAAFLAPALAQADGAKTGVYVTPKFNVGFLNWQAKGEADAEAVGPALLGRRTDSFDFDSGSSNTVLGGSLAVGYDFYHKFDVPLRFEVEYGIYGGGSGSEGGSVSTAKLYPAPLPGMSARGAFDIDIVNIQTLMANLWWDFRNDTAFTPYVGGGIGVSFIQAKGDVSLDVQTAAGPLSISKELGGRTTSNFAWQLGAGCAWNITDTVALDLGYRFMSLGSAETAEETVSRPDGFGTISVQAQGKAENIYMHQVGLGIRITF